MAGRDHEKMKKQQEKEKAAAEAAALKKTLAHLSMEEGSRKRVIDRVVHGGGDGSMPQMMLTRTNYCDWAMITELQLKADELWHVVEEEHIPLRLHLPLSSPSDMARQKKTTYAMLRSERHF